MRVPPHIQTQLDRFAPGTVVADRYEIEVHLGRGGSGFVCKAKDLSTPGRNVALKFLFANYANDEKLFARFKREFDLATKLDHPNIIRAFDFGDVGSTAHYIVMEFVEGESLSAKLNKYKPSGIPIAELVPYLSQVAQGLQYAHEQGVIHRDIKPGNIMIGKDGVAKIADYGIGRPITTEEHLTRTREVLGSAAYMSPEQCRGIAVGHYTDIYSFGIMAYELATGEPPFNHPDPIVVIVAHESEPIPDCASKEKGIPVWFARFIEKACAKDTKARFSDMAAAKDFLDRYTKSRKGGGGVPLWAIALVSLIVLVVACLAVLLR